MRRLALQILGQRGDRAEIEVPAEDGPYLLEISSTITSFLSTLAYPSGTEPPTQMPFFLEAAILSRTRSPITSRSNCANERSIFSVRRPMLLVVLNDWVTETKETPCSSKTSTSLAKSPKHGLVGRLCRPPRFRSCEPTVAEEGLQSRAVQRSTREATVVIVLRAGAPAFVGLTLYIGLAGFALGIKRVELEVKAARSIYGCRSRTGRVLETQACSS